MRAFFAGRPELEATPLREACDAPLLFHLAESEEDLTETYARFGRRVGPRLDALGLLGPHTVAAFARSVDRAEASAAADRRC